MPQFQSHAEARAAFVDLMRALAYQQPKRADRLGVHSLDVRWTIQQGYTRTILEVKRWDLAGTHSLELKCGSLDCVVGTELGTWQYFCREALGPNFQPPRYEGHSIFDTFEELRTAVISDVGMYLDGSYTQSQVRPRSRAQL